MFAREEAQHGVLVMMGMRSGDVDDVDVWVFDKVFIGAVGGGGGGAFAGFEELFGAGGGGRGGGGGDGVFDVRDGAGGGVDHEVFGEF